MTARSLIVGVGNRYREDDGIGPAVVERVKATAEDGVDTLALDDVMALLDAMSGYDNVVIVDATAPQGSPGKVRRFDGHDTTGFAESGAVSTHGFGLAGVLRMAVQLSRMPVRVVVLGIEGQRFGHGEGLSPELASAVDEAAQLAIQALRWTESQDFKSCGGHRTLHVPRREPHQSQWLLMLL